MTDYAVARANMVENQLRPSRIDDPGVLEAMGEVPRELFVPEALRGCAYGDEDLALGGGRHLIEPLALAKLLQTAAPNPQDVVLVAGDVTGYAAAIMARLAGSVFCLLPDAALIEQVQPRLMSQGSDNVALEYGASDQGLPARAPFDLILLVGSVPVVPQALIEQLADSGRLVGVVEHGRSGKVTLVRKVHGAVGRVTPFDAQVYRLPGLTLEPAFSF
jgi:protein-L-isoaspartate(D-aspartate) O-methyltransferase